MLLTEDRTQRVTLAAAWDGTGTAPDGSVVEINSPGTSTCAIQITGAMTATVEFEGIVDEKNGTWFSVNATPYPTGTAVTSATAAGVWIIPCATITRVRARCSAYTNGSPVVCLRASMGTSPQLAGGGTASAVTIANGADTAEGTTTDAAIVTDTSGTVIGFLRGLVKILADVWSSARHTLHIEGGQAAGAAITENPVVIAGQNAGNVKLWAMTSGGLGIVAGGLSHNSSVPGTDFIEALPALANAAAPTYTEGNSVLLSANLSGSLRTIAAGHTPAAPTCTFTRPANTTAYTIGDEVGTSGTSPTTVSVARFNGGTGIIQGARVFYSGYPATVPQLVVLLFSTNVTLAGDNAQLSVSDTDAKTLICTIPLTASQSSQYSAGAPVSAGGVWLSGTPARPAPHYIAGASQQTIYACLITLNAFTPIANSETLDLFLDIENN